MISDLMIFNNDQQAIANILNIEPLLYLVWIVLHTRLYLILPGYIWYG